MRAESDAVPAATSGAVPAAVPVDLRCDDRTLVVSWDDGRVSTFHFVWLRDNCPQLRHATTNHRVVETSEIPTDIRPATVAVGRTGAVEVTWAHDGHVSTFDANWLRAYDYSKDARVRRREPILWDSSIGDAMPRASYPNVLADDVCQHRLMAGFRDYGVAVLHDVPTVPGTVLDVAAVFGELRVTSWGKVFDVISIENANSVAYTSLPLVAHTDEGYRDPAPTIQLQHFLVTEAVGGEATLVDGFRVANDLRAEHPAMFDLLASTSLHFDFRDDTSHHEHFGSIFDVEANGRLRSVRFSNHSVQPFLIEPDLMEPFYDAYRTFGRMRESAHYKLQLQMNAGDLYMVDNRRVMHGRNGFRQGGNRHLQSCYIERDEFMSRLSMLDRTVV